MEFIKLFRLKLEYENDITFEDIKNLFDAKDIVKFRNFLDLKCYLNFDIINEDIKISWNQLRKIFSSDDPKSKMLMFYYSEIYHINMHIYMRCINRSKSLICTTDEYNTYMHKLYTNTIKKLVSYIPGLNSFAPIANTLAESTQTCIKEIVDFQYIDTLDIKMIDKFDLEIRIEILNVKFIELLQLGVISVDNLYKGGVAGSADPDEVV